MAKAINYEGLSQIDSTLSKYFSKHMASVLVREEQNIAAKKKAEAGEYIQAASSINLGVSGNIFSQSSQGAQNAQKNGVWNKQTSDDLIKATQKAWDSDPKVKNDIRTLTTAFYVELCKAKNGGRDSKELAQFAVKYVQDRLINLTIDQLARQRMPKDSIRYIAKHSFTDSLLGTWLVSSSINRSDLDKYIEERSEDIYDPSGLEIVGGFLGSVAVDYSMLRLSGLGGLASKGAKATSIVKKLATNHQKLTNASLSFLGWQAASLSVDGAAALMTSKSSVMANEDIQESAKKIFGDENVIDTIRDGADKYRKKQTELQGQLNSALQKKIKIKPEEFNEDRKHYSNSMLRNHRGNSNKVFDNLKSDFKKNGIAFNPKASIPLWMTKLTAKQCRAYAASFYGMAMEMKEQHITHAKMPGGKVMSLQQVAQRAYDYGHAAASMDTPGTALNFKTNTKGRSDKFLKNIKGNNSKLITEIEKGLWNHGIFNFTDTNKPPSWMLYGKTAQEDRHLASYFYSLAVEMTKTGKNTIKLKGGKVMTLQQVAQRAFDYARAADAVETLRLDNDKVSSAVLSRRWDEDMARTRKMIGGDDEQKKKKSSSTQTTTAAPSQSSYYQNQQTNAATQPDQSSQGATQESLFSDMTGGWGNALDSMGLGDFGTTKKNLGYVMAMLPDMLIGMFTGRNPDLKLGDNLLPLASIVGGAFIKNPLLKMIFMGYGGLNLLNNAGHAAVKQRNESVSKVYRSYSDEPLNPRLSNPAMKGSSMIVNIDRVPVVLSISSDAVAAYEQGKVPLNTLANAVLKKYDENRSLASQGYEQGVARGEEQNVSRQLK